MNVVDRSVSEFLGNAYSTRCFACSAAIEMLLKRLGILCAMTGGAMCIVEAFPDGSVMWGGFWGADHHIWVETEFAEVADLSVSRLHEHPASHRPDALPAPPIWWRLGDWSPEAFVFAGPSGASDFDDAEGTAELFGFLDLVRARFADTLAKADVGDIVRPQLLDSDDALRRLAARNDRWAKAALAVKKMGLRFPAWVKER